MNWPQFGSGKTQSGACLPVAVGGGVRNARVGVIGSVEFRSEEVRIKTGAQVRVSRYRLAIPGLRPGLAGWSLASWTCAGGR